MQIQFQLKETLNFFANLCYNVVKRQNGTPYLDSFDIDKGCID